MRLHCRNIAGLAILAVAALFTLSLSGPAFADDCVAKLLGTINLVTGECEVVNSVTVSGFVQLDETLHLFSPAVITVSPPAAPPVPSALTIDIAGSFIMNAGSKVSGNTALSNTPGATISITASVNMTLCGPLGAATGCGGPSANVGAIIQSNNTAGSCNGVQNTGGNITLHANGLSPNGVFTMEGSNPPSFVDPYNPDPAAFNGSEVLSISPCGRGEIIVTAGFAANIDGLILSEGLKAQTRGGPVTVNAGCVLNESDTGAIMSVGKDLGADLVHLQAGCQVQIFGLVVSTGPGHSPNSDARCNAPVRPSHSNRTSPYSTACVEIWAGNNSLNPGTPAILIDSRPPHMANVHADVATAGGVTGNGWIELFARGDIEIDGDTLKPFAVHANQYRSSGHGGQITVKSTEAGVVLLGLALQASADRTLGGQALGGSDGGTIIVEAKKDINLNNSTGEIQANGSPTGGGSHGGHISIRAFGTVAPDGSILATAPFVLDATGHTPPDGTIDLKACGTINSAALTFSPAGLVPTVTPGVCGGVPTLPVYPAVGAIAALPPLPVCSGCGGACGCVNNFSPLHAAGGATLTLNGDNLTVVDSVIFAANCDPGSAAPGGTVLPPFTTQTGSTITLPVPGAPLANGAYKIIITFPIGLTQGSCCAGGFFNKP